MSSSSARTIARWEAIKDPALKDVSQGRGDETAAVVFEVFKTYLKLFHPFLPYVTEKLWQALVPDDGMLIRAAWPTVEPNWTG